MNEYDRCIRTLLERCPDLALSFDSCPGVYVVPVVLDETCTEIPENVGRLEYQVSDGPPGSRGKSYDCYSLDEALESARVMSKELQAA